MKTMAWMMAVMMGMSVGAVAGTGSVDDPYTIAQARALPVGTTEYWAQGYIVGGRYDDFEAPWANDFAVSCADADSETVFANCLQVVLLNDGGRAAWGLSSNPGNVGKLIKFKGYRDAYGTHPAFKPVNNADISEVILEDQPPVIAAIGNKMVIEGNTLSFTVTATDAVDGDQIALIATSLPAGATFTGATNAGMATGTFTWENAGSLGDYSATFQATDKDGSDTETVSITVHDGSGPLAIAFQGFEGTANDTWTMTDVDPSLVLNTTGAGDLPANQRVRTGSYSWQPGEGEYTTEALELAEVDISAWSEVVLTLHVSATTSEPGDGFGMYPTESLSVFLALDGGDYPGEADITVTGNELEVGEISGALWGFGATGVASTTAGVSRTVAPASGGVAADGIATVRIAIPAGTTSVKLKAEVAQEYAGYFWNVDDIELVGVNDGGASDYPPSLSLSPDGASKSVRVGQSLSFDVTATQIPNDASDEIRLWATGLPSGATFPEVTGTSPLSGTFNWTPAEAASAAVSFFAGDKDGTNQVDVSITAYELPESGAHYGVFVGLNKYSSSYIGSSGWLNGCVPDANHIYTNTTQRGDWTAATVTRLLDGAGTKAAIRRSITNYAAEAVAGDTFFYYHSSHGGQNSGTSVYLCAFDNDYQDTELAADLQKFATGVKVVVMVDACHSGGLFKSARAGTRAVRPPSGTWDLAGIVSRIMDETRAERLAAGMRDVETRVSSSEIGWVTAADYDQYSWDGDDGGAFTDAVIYGWDSGFCDNATYGNQDGYANFYELWNYAKDIAIGYPGEFDPYDGSSYETDAQAHNTNVLLATLAGWVGDSAPGGLVVFNNMTPQGVTVGEELVVPVSAYTAGTSTPVTVTMTTVQAGASYAGGQLTFTPAADGIYVFNFTGTNTLGASANASLTVTATLAAPALSAPTGIGNERFTANWEAVAGAASYRLDVATADTFSPGGTGESGVIVDTPNAVLNEGWAYVNGAEMGSSGVNAYHKLVSASDPGVVSAAFSTMSYLEAAAEFSVATYGGTSANQLVVSYSLDGGSTWIPFGTNTSASSTTYVTGLTIPLPAAALNQPSVRVKWHCPVSTASVGLRLRALVVSGAQAAGGNTLVLSGQSVAGTSHQVTGLEMDTTYYYRVKAVGNSSGPLSATGTATTTAEDTAPSFAAIPAQSATRGAPFTLNVGAYASGYPVPAISVVSSTADAGDYSMAAGSLTFTPSETGEFEFVFSALNDLGSASATTTVAVTEAPVLIPTVSIADLDSDSFTVNWNAVTDATDYQVQVATDDEFSSGGGGGVVTDLFISEYIEGLSNNKAIEIFNGTGSAVNLGTGGYALKLYFNGGASPSTIVLSGTIADGDVFVVANTSANAAILAQADQTSGSLTFNGNDVVALAQNDVNIDVVGTIGNSDNFALDVTKVRKSTVSAGTTTYDPAEWDNFAVDTTSDLGSHTFAAGGGGEGSIIVDETVASLTYPVTGLDPETPYWVRVRAADGDWSEVVSATTLSSGPTAPAFAAIPAQSATLSEPFTLNVAAYASGNPVPTISVASSTADAGDYSMAAGSLTFTPSETGEFEFVFSALNDLGSASATTTVTVTETPVLIPTVSIADLDSDSFTVNWNAVTDATDYQVQVATDDEFSSGGDPGGANRMVNPGFETGDNTGWIKFEAEYAVVTTDPQEGIYHAACTATATRDLMQVVNIEGDGVTEYEVSFWYKKPLTNGNARIWATWATGGQASGDNLTPTNYLPAVEQWTKQTYHVVPQSGANSLNFEVRTYNGATVYWDNFFVGVAGSRSRSEGSILVDETVAALTYPVTGLDPETPYWVRVRSADGDWSEVVSATTLAEGGPPPTPDVAGFAVTAGSTASATLAQSAVGTTYVLQYTTDLLAVPILWTDVDTEEGTGGEVTLEDDNLSDDMRFYRVIVQ